VSDVTWVTQPPNASESLNAIILGSDFRRELVNPTVRAFAHESVEGNTVDFEFHPSFEHLYVEDCVIHFARRVNDFMAIVVDQGFRINRGNCRCCDGAFRIAGGCRKTMKVGGPFVTPSPATVPEGT
jgi:hypothetical protein